MTTFYPIVIPDKGGTESNFLYERYFTIRQREVRPLAELCMLAVLEHPALVEEACSTLPQQLRRRMVRLAVERRWTDSVVPLLYTWAEPTLCLRSLFPDYVHCPRLGKQLTRQVTCWR